MPEYLSPGVYVEEFESEARIMEGVSTSIAGFTGLAVKGPVGEAPQSVTNMTDFRRKYGATFLKISSLVTVFFPML